MASKWAVCLLVGASLNLGCTFITSCPTPTDTNPGGGGKGSGGSNGTSGSANTAGSTGEDGVWVNVTANLAPEVTGPAASCGNTYVLASKPGEDFIIAGIGEHGLWGTTDGGESWTKLGVSATSEPILNIPSAIVFDPDNPDVFWEAGMYESGIFKTEDHGVTFNRLGNTRHNELVSVDFSDPERKVLVAGGHEQFQELWRSENGGVLFDDIGDQVPAEAGVSSWPLVLDASTYLLGTQDFGGGINAIFRTTDSGATWDQVAEDAGYLAPLRASDGTIYWSGTSDGDMLRSSDDGLTWEAVASTGSGLSVVPSELPDGRIVSVSDRYVVVSDDKGQSWQAVSPPLPFPPRAVTYSPEQKAFFISHETCKQTEAPNAVMRFDFDYEKN